MVENTGLENFCIIADTANEMKQRIKEVFRKQFSTPDILMREAIITENFSNKQNAQKLLALLS
jgi:hypothetical protein